MPETLTPLAMILDALADVRRELGKELEGQFAGETVMLATETLVLAELNEYSTRTPSELATATGLSRGRVSHILDNLEQNNLINRHQDSSDRRRWIVALTPDGRLAAEDADERVRRIRAQSSTVLGEGGLESVHQQLRQIQRAIRERRDDTRSEVSPVINRDDE